MIEKYFGIRYCFNKETILSTIDSIVANQEKGYVCVADGVTLALTHRDAHFKQIIGESTLTTCDSGWVPIYLKSLYKIEREQYCGSDLMMDLVQSKRYNIMFLGSDMRILDALKEQLLLIDPRIETMTFSSLPFLPVEEFDYPQIATDIDKVNPDIILISLGMPKQEIFMNKIKPYINRGVLVGVGAAFKFHSGLVDERRAPKWMIKSKLEWLHRIFSEPKKQLKRCGLVISTLPMIYWKEYKSK